MEDRPSTKQGHFDDVDGTYSSSKSDSRSFSRILQEIVNHLTEIIRSEVRLARTEIRQDVAQVAKASAFVAVGAVFALYALGFILLGVVYALATRMAPWLSAVSVGVAVGIVAAIFCQVGRTKIKHASLKPDKTIQSLEENVRWMKTKTK